MELATTLINLGIFAATAIAAIIAWRSVRDAQQARDDAAEHERSAVAAAGLAASAQTRIADILEEVHRPPAELWTIERESGYTWRVVNNTGYSILWACVTTPLGRAETKIRPKHEIVDDLPPGGKMMFDVIDPAAQSATLTIVWHDPESYEQRTWTKEVPLR